MSERHNAAALYRRMSEPYPDADAANESIAAFFAEVEALREKHRVANVMIIVEVSMMDGTTEVQGFSRLFRGSSLNMLPMIARAYGAIRQSHDTALAMLLARGPK